MSDVSQGPGWWIASDGKWYPPEAHPTAHTPASSPGTFWDQTPHIQPDEGGILPSHVDSVVTRSPRRLRSIALVVLLVVVVSGLSVFGYAKFRHDFVRTGGSTTTTSPGGTGRTQATQTPQAAAEEIGLQFEDFGKGFAVVRIGEQPPMHSTRTTCDVTTKKAPIGEAYSRTIVRGDVGPYISTDIKLFAKEATAQNTLKQIMATTKGTACFKPSAENALTGKTYPTNKDPSCYLRLSNERVSKLQTNLIQSGISGWVLEATAHCTADTATRTVSLSVLYEIIDNVSIEGDFVSFATPTLALETRVMAVIAGRAHTIGPRFRQKS